MYADGLSGNGNGCDIVGLRVHYLCSGRDAQQSGVCDCSNCATVPHPDQVWGIDGIFRLMESRLARKG
jgi:hypothetical protein